jgi:DNA invertase Pin-like site-specific DNA recombinase
VSHWRGQRDERAWPTAFQRGGKWPWTPVTDENEQRWLSILQARADFGEPMTERDVVDATKMPKTTVHRILARHAREWQVANAQKADDDE